MRPGRDAAVDFYRVSGVALIVLGHWLAACVTYHESSFGRQNPLVELPWTQWLTWPFQAVPVFFLVAGYASATSWTQRCGAGMSRQDWLGQRLARVLGPTAVYVGLVSLVVVVLQACGVASAPLDYAGWALAMHLWFLAIYLVVVSLTPIAIAAQQRWGLLAPGMLGAALLAVDALAVGAHLQHLGWLNYLLCWGTLYQLGIAWRSGCLVGYRPVALAAGSAIALALLIGLGPYPVSMIGVPGQTVQNTSPPSMAMLAFAGVQAGVTIAIAPALNQLLRPSLLQRALSGANSNVMALYLWHMVPVIGVAVVGYPAGWFVQPVEGTAQWWLVRLEWVAIIGLVAALELVLLWCWRGFFAAPLPGLRIPSSRWVDPLTLAGVGMAAAALALFAAGGFAPAGRFPWLTAFLFSFGVGLVRLRPVAGARWRRSGRSDQ